jgi:YhcH/YjgK/YiaL family protein
MIVGNINDFTAKDFAYSKNLQIAFDYLNKLGLDGLLKLEAGKHMIKEDGEVYVNRSSYVGKEFKDAKIEGHEKWLDIQIVLANAEDIGYVDKRKYDGKNITVPYNAEKDKTNYEGELDAVCRVAAGYFVLVYPNDLHKPCIKVNDNTIEKAVVKVKIDW